MTTLSIIVPAHQEEALIRTCLQALADRVPGHEVEVIVIGNGCTDATTARARSFESTMRERDIRLRVVELETANKTAALNMGDDLARHGNRVYVDADVRLGPGAVAAIAAALDSGVLFCAPEVHVAPHGYCSRTYGRVWSQLPSVTEDVIGAGVYAVGAAGRSRWGRFPPIIADDKFARLHFLPTERRVLTETHFTIHLPCGARELIRVRSRWNRGNRQLRHRHPELAACEVGRLGRLPSFLLRHPRLWPDLPSFAALYAAASLRSWLVAPSGESAVWERADRARSEGRTRGRRRGGISRRSP